MTPLMIQTKKAIPENAGYSDLKKDDHVNKTIVKVLVLVVRVDGKDVLRSHRTDKHAQESWISHLNTTVSFDDEHSEQHRKSDRLQQ